MKTKQTLIERAAAMPATTWHFLNMNDVRIEIPEDLAIAPKVRVFEPWASRGSRDEFENALADAQEAWELEHPEPTAEEQRARAELLEAEADATYGGTAQSNYQVQADAIEEARSLSVAFEHGMGDEVAAYLRYAAEDRVVISAGPGEKVNAQVLVSSVQGGVSVAAIDVVADEGSDVELSVVVDSEQDAAANAGADRASQGLVGTTVRVFADKDARVRVERTQALQEGFTDIDDMGLFAGDRARIDVRQAVLGGSCAYAGLAGDLRGSSSRIEVETRYLGRAEQVRDFNYSLRHHGAKTRCNLQANGVLADKSKKTLRGTIDLVRGCKGAEGSENETVLLVDEGVHNKTVPVILCNEDDVAGNHGATIGHIRDEQLFYLASRGLAQDAAERMFASAIVEQAALDAGSAAAREAVVRLGERMSPGFAELFEGADDDR